MDVTMEQIAAEEEVNEEKNKIASEILKVLSREQVTVSEAISILGITKGKILKSRTNLLSNR